MGMPAEKFDDEKDEVMASVAALVSEVTGVQLGPKQQSMVESRLRRRISELNLEGFADYWNHLQANSQKETENLIAILTTHHTYFFREFSQFEVVESHLPRIVEAVRKRGDSTIRVWSAACSRGQEAYSIGMFLLQHLKTLAPDVKLRILGSDVDSESVAIARNGVYHRREIKDVPIVYMADHWAKGKDEIADYVKARGPLRDSCEFETINLLDFSQKMAGRSFDLIFCRNVFIYFSPEKVRSITERFLRHLEPHGQIYVGISESLQGLGLPLEPVGPSVYAMKGAAPVAPVGVKPAARPAVLRVLCVDDSPSILAILKKLLTKEHGFEVVGTAVNGLEAAQKVSELRPDLVTLDIHMPQQTGVEYLERNFRRGHPPVVMVTSVARESADLALRALKAGAADYVEKPSLSNMGEKGEEIRTKLKCALRAHDLPAGSLDTAFARKPVPVANPDACARVVFCSLADRARVGSFLKDLGATGQPPCVLLVEGGADGAHLVAKQGSVEWGRGIVDVDSAARSGTLPDLKAGGTYVASLGAVEALRGALSGRAVSALVFGVASKQAAEAVVALSAAGASFHLLVEGVEDSPLNDAADDVVPATSFAYMSSEALGK
ncbi:MAG: response regulator [Bdellovibrionales bacterium]|nr:response regulator [Bdellovibrionales bacterium]